MAYRCSAAPRPHAMFAVHLLLFLDRFEHEGSAGFGSRRQIAVFVFIRPARRAQQPAASSNLVPLLGVWVGNRSPVKTPPGAFAQAKYLPGRNPRCLLVAPQWLQLLESCSLSSLSRSSSLAELASPAEEEMSASVKAALHFNRGQNCLFFLILPE